MSSTDLLVWKPEETVMTSRCPVCAAVGDKRYLLDMNTPVAPGRLLQFLKCPACGCGYVEDFQYPDYHGYQITGEALRFYVEQGAGMDILCRPAHLGHRLGVRNYLEIGCGFGFGVDFAKRAYGMNARGIDPAPQALRGRDALGIDIISDYLTSESVRTLGQQDMIVAMEVIEHIKEPQPLLKLIKDNLTPRGVVVMSTPNVAALADRDSQMLLPILSPGFHSVLFSADALKAEFLKAGFGFAAVQEDPHSLLVVATVDGTMIEADLEYPHEAFADYSARRMTTIADDNSLWSGYAYRNFKTLINLGSYAEAEVAFSALRDEYQRRFDVDIADPGLFAARFEIETDRWRKQGKMSDWGADVPFHVCNLFYFIGILRMNTKGDDDAFDYFHAAVKVAEARMAYYRAGGYGDGETEALARQSYKYLARCALARAREPA